MSQATLEERVARLENLVDQLFTGPAQPKARRKDWRRTIGMFDGDPVMKEIKIASIALVHYATLVSANLRDFEKVPGLVVEDWLKD